MTFGGGFTRYTDLSPHTQQTFPFSPCSLMHASQDSRVTVCEAIGVVSKVVRRPCICFLGVNACMLSLFGVDHLFFFKRTIVVFLHVIVINHKLHILFKYHAIYFRLLDLYGMIISFKRLAWNINSIRASGYEVVFQTLDQFQKTRQKTSRRQVQFNPQEEGDAPSEWKLSGKWYLVCFINWFEEY